MLDHARAAVRYLGSASAAELEANEEKFSAVLWRVTLVGEAAASFARDYPERVGGLPVKSARAMRNLLLHKYPEIDAEAVQATVHDDFPPLIAQLEQLLGEEPSA